LQKYKKERKDEGKGQSLSTHDVLNVYITRAINNYDLNQKKLLPLVLDPGQDFENVPSFHCTNNNSL
jgi:hypothetical protein